VAYDRAGKRAETCGLLDAPTGSIALDAPSCPRWVMPNAGGRGYYRVAYTAAQVTALRDLAWSQLEPTERSVAVFEASEAATLGKLPLALGLSFVPRLLAAGDRFSVGAALAIPVGLRDVIPDELLPAYEAWIRRTFGPAAHKAGLVPSDRDSLDVEVSRGSLLDAVGEIARDPALTAESIKLVDHWRDLPTATRNHVIALATHARPELFDRALHALYTEDDRRRRHEIVGALASTRDVERQRVALDLVLDPKLDIRDTRLALYGAELEPNRAVAQQFFRDHKDAIMKRFPADGTTAGLAGLAPVFTASCVAARRAELADYVTATFAKLPGGARAVAQDIEAMDQCIARRRLLEPAIRAWLAGR
jgi:alanyl aminopeptidase